MSSLCRLYCAMAFLCWFGASCAAFAAEAWIAEKVEKPELPREIVAQSLAPAPSRIPAMLTATAESGGISRAWFAEPTSRYRHGVLGDAIEAGALIAEGAIGPRMTYRLDELHVFEDLYPRIADLDGNGKTEIVTILSSLQVPRSPSSRRPGRPSSRFHGRPLSAGRSAG